MNMGLADVRLSIKEILFLSPSSGIEVVMIIVVLTGGDSKGRERRVAGY